MTDLMGKSLSKLTVTADTARHLGDDAVVLSKKLFSASASDPLVDVHIFVCLLKIFLFDPSCRAYLGNIFSV